MELYPGAMIAGRYRASEKIGSGGMGEVWAGEQVNIGVRIALKTLLPVAEPDRHLVARFRREAQLLGRLRTERVARIVDFVEDRDFGLVLIMEFVEGEILGSVLAARRLAVEEAIDVGVDIASALCELHRAKIVHRDLKPDNVILEPVFGGRQRAVIVDLGVGRLDEGGPGDEAVTSLTQSDMAVGTLPYMAPEQLLSSSTATAAADVYALGAILFRAIAGGPVFDDVDDGVAARRKLADDAPPLSLPRIDRVASSLSALVARALSRDPDRRPTAEELLAELVALADVSRALAIDLDALTEQAPPLGLAEPASSIPDAETTRRMSRPPVEASSIDDELTLSSPSSQALPHVDEAVSSTEVSVSFSGPATPAPTTKGKMPGAAKTLPIPTGVAASPPTSDTLNASTIRQTRPTVHSAILVTPPAPDAEPASGDASAPSTVSTRLVVVAILVALAVGAAAGFDARGRVVPRAAPVFRPPP